jgi:hypothetical protein
LNKAASRTARRRETRESRRAALKLNATGIRRLMARDADGSNARGTESGCLKLGAYCLRKRLAETAMSISSKAQIDSEHCRAICDEIGARLRMMLSRDVTALPVQLRVLMDRLAEQDDMIPAPSIVPSIEDMMWPLQASDDRPELARVA